MIVEYINRPWLEPDGTDNLWTLARDFYVRISTDDGEDSLNIVIPAGFGTDLASVPRVPGAYLLFGGRARLAAILHDYLYHLRYERKWADSVFLEALRGEVNDVSRYAMWAAVRLGGGSYYRDVKAGVPTIHPETNREAP